MQKAILGKREEKAQSNQAFHYSSFLCLCK